MAKIKRCGKCDGKGAETTWVVFNRKGEIVTEERKVVCKRCLGTGYEGLRR